MESITLPDSMTAIAYCSDGGIGVDTPFVGCSSLKEINVSTNNSRLKSDNGVLFDGTLLVRYPSAKSGTKYTVPKNVIAINGDAFEGCKNLTEIIMSETINEIGNNAFDGCSNLKSITFLNKKATYGYIWCDFNDCPSLTIYGYKGSGAETLAKQYSLKFVALDATTTKPSTTKPSTTISTTSPNQKPEKKNTCSLSMLLSKKLTETTAAGYSYLITANVENTSIVSAENVKATFNVPKTAKLKSGNAVVNLGTILAKEKAEVKWEVISPVPLNDEKVEYSVLLKSDNADDVVQKDYYFAKGSIIKDNRLNFTRDVWNFDNSVTYFGSPTENYYMNEEHYKALTSKLSNTYKKRVDDMLNDNWGGSCYGLSALVVLNKMGIVSPTSIQNTADIMKGIKKVNNDYVESYVNYYHCSQLFPSGARYDNLNKPDKEQLVTLETQAKLVQKSGTPVLLCFIWRRGEEIYGHAIVAQDVQTGIKKVYGGVTYNSCIVTWDPNYQDGNELNYLYYNTGTNEWCIPAYTLGCTSKYISAVSSDVSKIDATNLEVNSQNNKAILELSKASDNVQIKYADVSVKISDILNGSRNDIQFFVNANYVLENPQSSPLNIILPSIDEGYDITVNSKEETAYAMTYANSYSTVSASNMKTLSFEPDGSVSFTASDASFDLSATYNEGYYSLPWYTVEVKGTQADSSALSSNDDGIIIESDSKKPLTIEASNGTETKQITVEAQGKDVLLNSKDVNGVIELAAYVDKDNDGSFETLIETSSDNDSSIVQKLSKSKTVIIILSVTLIVAIVASSTVLIIKFKKKKKEQTV